MNYFRFLLLSLLSTQSLALPITYIFTGQTQTIFSSEGSYAPHDVLVGNDGSLILNGQSQVSGTITYDPDAWRSGAGGEGLSEVLHWSLNTEGRTYYSAGNFHYLDYDSDSFFYSDEVPLGGFGPDIVNLSFNFNTNLFAGGPSDFLTEHFVDGLFSIQLEWAHTSDGVHISGLAGSITKLTRVPESPLISLLAGGLCACFLGYIWRRRFF
jgi:hypothetical protein